MEITNSWMDVRNAHDCANQMAGQTVEAFAAIGDMLIALKVDTPHGEFGRKCAEAFGQITFGESNLKQSLEKAGKYMRLAQHRNDWLPHNPQSLNEAMKMLPAKRAARKPGTVINIDPSTVDAEIKHKYKSWSTTAIEQGLCKTSGGGARVALRDKLLKITGLEKLPKPKEMTPEINDLIVNAIEVLVQEKAIKEKGQSFAAEEVNTLSETSQQKFDRLLKKEFARLQAEFNIAIQKYEKEFNERVWSEFKRVNKEWLADSQAVAARHTKALNDMQTQRRGITPHITPEDYKFLLNCLHPDRAPDDRKDKFSKAFQIVKKLDNYIEVIKVSLQKVA